MARVSRGTRGKPVDARALADKPQIKSEAPAAGQILDAAVELAAVSKETPRTTKRSAASATPLSDLADQVEIPRMGGVTAPAEPPLAPEIAPIAAALAGNVIDAGTPPATPTSLQTTVPATWLHGFIDEARANRITGWVWDPQQPQQRVAIDLVGGDTRLARVVANEFRADLAQAGIGDGRHAFTMPFRQELLGNDLTVLHLRCAETGADIPGSPIRIQRHVPMGAQGAAPVAGPALQGEAEPYAPEATRDGVAGSPTFVEEAVVPFGPHNGSDSEWNFLESQTQPALETETGLQSNVDSTDWTGIKGWIWNPGEPGKRVALELFDGDAPLTMILADQYRPDLEQAGFGDGRYGFSIAFSESLLPYARHVLHLRPVDAVVELPSFPLVLTRDQVGLDPSVRFVLGNIMAEAARADKAQDLAPVVSALIEFLDAALSRYFEISDDTTARAVDLLNPADLAPQLRNLIESLQWNYPPVSLDIAADRPPVVSIVIPVFNKFDLTYNCIKSIIEHGAQIPFEMALLAKRNDLA